MPPLDFVTKNMQPQAPQKLLQKVVHVDRDQNSKQTLFDGAGVLQSHHEIACQSRICIGCPWFADQLQPCTRSKE